MGDNLIFLMIGRLSESWEKLSDVWDLNAQAVSAYVMILKENAVIDLNIHPNVLSVDLSNQQHIREAASEVLNHFQELPPLKKKLAANSFCPPVPPNFTSKTDLLVFHRLCSAPSSPQANRVLSLLY